MNPAGIFEQHLEQAVGECRETGRRLQSGEFTVLERLAHIDLDAGQVAAEDAERQVSRQWNGQRDIATQRLPEEVCGGRGVGQRKGC